MATRTILFRGQTRRKGERTSISGIPLPGIWVAGGVFPQNKGYDYQTKAGKAHDFNRGMKGRTLELLWEKFQNNFVYIHVFVTTWHLKYDIIDT